MDAVFVPANEVRIAAARVAHNLGLEEDWLNDGVKGFTPGVDVEQVGVYEGKPPRRSGVTQVFARHEIDGL
ncbi:MAG: hypothetical protein ABSG24_04660 [Acidimicrobiales bacterium]